MVDLKKLIKKSKRPLTANEDVTTFNSSSKTDMTTAIFEIIRYGETHG